MALFTCIFSRSTLETPETEPLRGFNAERLTFKWLTRCGGKSLLPSSPAAGAKGCVCSVLRQGRRAVAAAARAATTPWLQQYWMLPFYRGWGMLSGVGGRGPPMKGEE